MAHIPRASGRAVAPCLYSFHFLEEFGSSVPCNLKPFITSIMFLFPKRGRYSIALVCVQVSQNTQLHMRTIRDRPRSSILYDQIFILTSLLHTLEPVACVDWVWMPPTHVKHVIAASPSIMFPCIMASEHESGTCIHGFDDAYHGFETIPPTLVKT